jgi:DNA-binding LytR/AlgR family response regulator
MLRLVMVEDEQPAIENLVYELNTTGIPYKVSGILRSVKESVSWFNQNDTEVDLIFMDIQLTDGISFEIFNQVNISIPVIFTTGYNQYIQTSLEYNGIDYLLKPIGQDKLKQSLNKFNKLRNHFTLNYRQLLNNSLQAQDGTPKDRIIVRKGIEFQSIRAEEVAYFYTEHKLVFLVDKEGKKYMAHASNLADLVAQLNNRIFYRANRKYIININFIRKYRPLDKVKVEVELSVPCQDSVVISQENASGFKNWIENL